MNITAKYSVTPEGPYNRYSITGIIHASKDIVA